MTKKAKIAKMAALVKKNVAKKQALPKFKHYDEGEYAYLFAQTIIKPGKGYKKKAVKNGSHGKGDLISRTIKEANYVKLAKNLIAYIENNNRLPNYLTYDGYKIGVEVYIDAFARIVNYYYEHKALPAYANFNSKAFESGKVSSDEVFNYFVKKFGNVKTIDDAFSKVKDRGYGYYYDDVYSNKTSIDRMYSRAGINCTDSCQVFWHIAKALGYEVRCIHVKCSGGDGHVRLQVKHSKNTGGEWINRDPAAILSTNGQPLSYNWCASNYGLLAVNPSWFLANVNR